MMASDAADRAKKSGQEDALAFSVGYIAAIRDLAVAEGAHGLARDIDRLGKTLKT